MIFLENTNSALIEKPDLILMLNNSVDDFTYLKEISNSGIPTITFCDYTKPKFMFNVDIPLAIPNGLRIDNSIILFKMVYWYLWDVYKTKIIKKNKDFISLGHNTCNTLKSFKDSNNDIIENFNIKLLSYSINNKIINLKFIKKYLSVKHKQYKKYKRILRRFHINIPKKIKKVNKWYSTNKYRSINYKQKYNTNFSIVKKIRKRHQWNKKIRKRLHRRKKWKLFASYRRFFSSKFKPKLKLHKYRIRLLMKILCNYFDYSYNFKAWWREVKTRSLFKRLVIKFTKNIKFISKLSEFTNRFSRQLGLLCRKFGLAPSLRSYKHIYNNKLILLNGAFIKDPKYLVENNSIFLKPLFKIEEKNFIKNSISNTIKVLKLVKSKFFSNVFYLKHKPDLRILYINNYLKKI